MVTLGEPTMGPRHLERAGTAGHAENGIGIEDASTVHRARFYGRAGSVDQAARRPPSV
jgi:hypothetical protein